MVMAGQIGQENVQHILVDGYMLMGYMVHNTIVVSDIDPCNSSTVEQNDAMPAIRGVKFVSIPVTDQDRALAFYTEKLGFAS